MKPNSYLKPIVLSLCCILFLTTSCKKEDKETNSNSIIASINGADWSSSKVQILEVENLFQMTSNSGLEMLQINFFKDAAPGSYSLKDPENFVAFQYMNGFANVYNKPLDGLFNLHRNDDFQRSGSFLAILESLKDGDTVVIVGDFRYFK